MSNWISNWFGIFPGWFSNWFGGSSVVPPTPSAHPTKFLFADPRGATIYAEPRYMDLMAIPATNRGSQITAEPR